jgi:hypothetical protein
VFECLSACVYMCLGSRVVCVCLCKCVRVFECMYIYVCLCMSVFEGTTVTLLQKFI